MIRTVMKLVTNAKNEGHSSIRPWDSDTPDVAGSRRFSASSVIANAKTPSLNASILAVSFSSRLSRSSTIVWRGTHRVDLNLLPEGRCMRAFQAYSIGMATKAPVSREEPPGPAWLREAIQEIDENEVRERIAHA